MDCGRNALNYLSSGNGISNLDTIPERFRDINLSDCEFIGMRTLRNAETGLDEVHFQLKLVAGAADPVNRIGFSNSICIDRSLTALESKICRPTSCDTPRLAAE